MAREQAAPATHRQLTVCPPGAGLVVMSGQIAVDAQGRLIGPDDPRAQAEECFARIGTLLAEAGCGWDDVAKLTCYLVDAADYPAYAAAKAERFPAGAPAGTAVIVAGLLVPGARMEVEAMAVVPPGAPSP